MKTKTEKSLETRKANKDLFSKQTITVDNQWSIHRVDAQNWEIRFKSKFHGFYHDVFQALLALPAKMLSEQASGSLVDVIRLQKAILQIVQDAKNGV